MALWYVNIFSFLLNLISYILLNLISFLFSFKHCVLISIYPKMRLNQFVIYQIPILIISWSILNTSCAGCETFITFNLIICGDKCYQKTHCPAIRIFMFVFPEV